MTLLAVVGVLALVAFFARRDGAATSGSPPAPGRAVSQAAVCCGDPAYYARGNLTLVAGRAQLGSARALAVDVAGPPSGGAAQGGQAITVRARATPGLTAYAYRRRIDVASPSDPALRAFLEYWLGLGARP